MHPYPGISTARSWYPYRAWCRVTLILTLKSVLVPQRRYWYLLSSRDRGGDGGDGRRGVAEIERSDGDDSRFPSTLVDIIAQIIAARNYVSYYVGYVLSEVR